MEFSFYLSAIVAVLATLAVLMSSNPVRALLYLIMSLLAISGVFFSLGAYFAGALEIIVYAGAIMVLFVFVVMMLNLGEVIVQQEKEWLKPQAWLGPCIMAALLLIALVVGMQGAEQLPAGIEVTKNTNITNGEVLSQTVGEVLFSRYVVLVQLASMLLLGGLVAAFHLGREHAANAGKEDAKNDIKKGAKNTAGGQA